MCIHPYLSLCTGSGWDEVNFLHSSLNGTVFLICSQIHADNSVTFYLQLKIYIAPRPPLFFTVSLSSEYIGWEGTKTGR